MDVRLIAFDLDGTVLDDDKSVPEENLRALKAAAERGIHIVPATGRIVEGVPEAIRELPFIRYYIAINGAYVYDAGEEKVLYRGEVPAELAVRLCEYMDSLPVLYDCYQYNFGWMSRDMFARTEEYFSQEPGIYELVKRSRESVDDLKETLRQRGDPVQTLQMYFKPEQMEERLRQIELVPRLFPGLTASSSLKNNIEINSVTAGKGPALIALARSLGLEQNQTVAFGDGSNDLSMIRAAGLGVAMANAEPAVKAAAGLITGKNTEAGVAQAIWRLLA